MALDSSTYSSDGLKPSQRQGAEQIYGSDSVHPHSNDYWFNTKGMMDGDGNGYSEGSYSDSWNVANAGAPGNNQVSVEFPGGYAGKCPTGQRWAKNPDTGEWKCTGAVQDWDQAVLVPDIETGSGDETVGIVIMPYNLVGDSDGITVDHDTENFFRSALDTIGDQNSVTLSNVRSYKEAAVESSSDISSVSDAPSLESISVKCYPDSDQTAGFEKTKDIDVDPTDTDPTPVAVTGKLELSGSSAYTCNWNYTSSDGDRNPVNDAGTPVDLASAGEKNDVLFNFFKDNRGFNGLKKSYSSSNDFEDALSNWNWKN